MCVLSTSTRTGSNSSLVQTCCRSGPRPWPRLTASRRLSGPDELLAHPSVELVINLTQAPVHAETNLAIVRSGKHLFSEKPLALARVDAASVLREAANAGLQVGGAADIYLGSALQRAKAMIAGGAIGIPVAAVSVVPTDEFRSQRYHDIFRGALLDLGPYHLGALTFLFGPVVRVAATAEVRFPEKFVLESEGGGSFPVDQATSTAGVLDLASGPVATILTTNDAHAYRPYLEVFGTEGSLSLADPVLYSGTLQHHTTTGVTNVRAATGHGFDGDARGLGVVEMAAALLGGMAPEQRRVDVPACLTYRSPTSNLPNLSAIST